MFSALLSPLRSLKPMLRLLLGTVGVIAALAVNNGLEARAQQLPAGGVDAILAQTSPDLFEVLQNDFADEYAQMSDALKLTIKTGGDIKQTTFEHLMAMRVAYGPSLIHADDRLLTEMADVTVEIYQALLDIDGPQLCGDYAIAGLPALAGTGLEAELTPLALRQLAAMLRAAKSGHDNPVDRATATDEDWRIVSEHSLTLGADLASYDAMALGEAVPGTCPSLIALLGAANETQTSGDLVRAEFLTMITNES